MACKNFAFELECSVCLEIPKIDTKVYQCKNGHLFCVICYSKVQRCSSCQSNLKDFSNPEDSSIRNLAVENMIRQLPSLKIEKMESFEKEFQLMKSSFESFEIDIKDFNMKLSLINSKINNKKLANLEKSYLMDGFGFVEVYVTSRGTGVPTPDERFSVYWGPNREDINFSGFRKSIGTSIEAACHAITQAGVLGITKLCVVMNASIPVYSYVQMFSEWKASNWTSSKGLPIPYARHLQALDCCLKKHNAMAVKFRGSSGKDNKIQASYELPLTYNQ